MSRFVEVVPLALTPLTPIHIGCGEDFEPTNYVIDGGVLYHFEPTRLALTQADRQRLVKCANQRADEAIRAVQRFFHERRAACREASRLAVPVAVGVAEWYAERVGRVVQREAGGRTVSNQLEIERTAHHPHTGMPYLPGSSLKGAMRTGWLNALDKGAPVPRDPEQGPRERSAEVEADLLGGTFNSDPFRLVAVADASGRDIRSRIVFAVDRRKQPRRDRGGQIVEEKNLFVRREAICGGQLHALRGEIRFKPLPAMSRSPGDVPPPDKRIDDFAALARACNRFYLPGLHAELETLRNLCADHWIEGFERLIASLKPTFDAGHAMLLRVGRHSGAESVTLDRRRWIRIKSGKRSQDYHWARAATTIWLAAEHESSVGALRPFGWLLAQRAGDLPGVDLERWCAAEMKTVPSVPAVVSVPKPSAPEPETPGETVWDRARLQYNAQNKRLTAITPNNTRAFADAPKGAELFARLPQEVQRQVRNGQYVWVNARVRGSELIAVEVKP